MLATARPSCIIIGDVLKGQLWLAVFFQSRNNLCNVLNSNCVSYV